MGLIGISFILLALVAGMFLLAKTKKEELGGFFKLVSYLVIGISFLALILVAGRHTCRMICKKGKCQTEGSCMIGGEACEEQMMKCEHRTTMMEGCCSMPGCCKMSDGKIKMERHMNMKIMKDSVVNGKHMEFCNEVGCKGHHEDGGINEQQEGKEKEPK
jgi:hypothetical protein